ncbi:mandelate racemase/muconate lactonizing enzyme family protein [Herbaspirillum sp. SJZ099]|uniref:mandelate racemase/muconate lactonizing enzyme family protein n=1 Tax=Herbaspirillum sp. SJZ099 TaxID=2572916 RepID=UPI0011A97ABD|nr:mandelate racemase/muconate lactonizing enzyme family protein [Herbaspirillum sp. SJZ099]TWC71412.1 L-alanine-DL-glutamate epimerase-like enolase superfamily enzyme [Herbaspirillum sp. SJZ099]
MHIRQIEGMRVAIACDTGKDPSAPGNPWSRMETLLVKVTTDDGMVGWGEAFGHKLNPVTMTALSQLVAPALIGKPADAAATLLQAQQDLHGFGRTGPVLYALSAIDIALWDIAAQRAGQPLRALMGNHRNVIERYASLVSYDNHPAEVARHACRVHAMGYRKIKLHETTLPAFLAAREALPPEVDLMLDVNCPWSLAEAGEVARQLKGRNIAWLEEPIWPPEDVDSLARVRALGDVPIAAGENVMGVEGFRRLFEAGAIDYAQPSVTKIGGITAMREVIALSRQFPVKVMPHCFYYGPGLMATAQIVATLPADIHLEVPFVHFEQRLHPYLDFSTPEMRLPDIPGLGFAPDLALLATNTVDSFRLGQ